MLLLKVQPFFNLIPHNFAEKYKFYKISRWRSFSNRSEFVSFHNLLIRFKTKNLSHKLQRWVGRSISTRVSKNNEKWSCVKHLLNWINKFSWFNFSRIFKIVTFLNCRHESKRKFLNLKWFTIFHSKFSKSRRKFKIWR